MNIDKRGGLAKPKYWKSTLDVDDRLRHQESTWTLTHKHLTIIQTAIQTTVKNYISFSNTFSFDNKP